MSNRDKHLAALALLLIASVPAAAAETTASVVELESPLVRRPPLQGYLRQPTVRGPAPAVVLLHACNGNWKRLDERWGKRIAAWGYVTLTVDSFGPRGLANTCTAGLPVDLAFDAYRALDFLVALPSVDAHRVAALGFSQGGLLVLSSVERGPIERVATNKFRAAAAFYPPCGAVGGDMTVPTLIMIGELDEWTPAEECRTLIAGEDGYGIARRPGQGIPSKLIVYPGAYHEYDVPALDALYFGYRLRYDAAATDRSAGALRRFLNATIGNMEENK